MFSSYLPEELMQLVSGMYIVVECITVAILLATKLILCLVLWRFFHWKLSLSVYLIANVFGLQFLVWVFYKVVWKCIYFIALDTFWSSVAILFFWGGHELNLLNLPQIWHMIFVCTHAMLDLTGDKRFDFEDVKVISYAMYKCTKRCTLIILGMAKPKKKLELVHDYVRDGSCEPPTAKEEPADLAPLSVQASFGRLRNRLHKWTYRRMQPKQPREGVSMSSGTSAAS